MKKIWSLVVLFLLLGWGVANATLYYGFGDESVYWPGWKDTIHDGNSHTVDGNTLNQDKYDYNSEDSDVVGTPNLTGGIVQTDDHGYLEKIEIFYTSIGSDYSAGDLFIDLDADQYWDYVVHNTYNDTNGHWTDIATSKLYQIHVALDSTSAYYLSNDTWNNGNNGDGFRNDHPTVLKLKNVDYSYIGDVSVSDFDHQNPAPGAVIFDFTGITFETDWDWPGAIIGFAPTCANDAIYSKVPEPATVLILGFGLLGLGICSSKRMKKKI